MAIGRSGNYERNRWCCGAGGGCDEGFTLFDGEGTATAETCWGATAYTVCCVDDNYEAGPPSPPPSNDELTVQRIDPGHCPHAASADDMHGQLRKLSHCLYTTTLKAAHANSAPACLLMLWCLLAMHCTGAQSNSFLANGGPLENMFQEEYMRFLQEMLDMPEFQPCSVADAAAVLLHAESGVIRAAYGT
jgi:hypothetical protein